MREYEQDIRARHYFDFKAAIYAGLIVGILFLFLPRGIPWTSWGLPTEAMGRSLFGQDSTSAMFLTGTVQIVMAVAYTLIISMVIYRYRMLKAVLIGGLIGIGLYAVNYLFFRFLIPTPGNRSELTVFLTHLSFCFIAAGAYKGISIPKPKLKEHG